MLTIQEWFVFLKQKNFRLGVNELGYLPRHKHEINRRQGHGNNIIWNSMESRIVSMLEASYTFIGEKHEGGNVDDAVRRRRERSSSLYFI